MLQQTHRLELFADYHQFYVHDGGINPSAPEDWSDNDVANRAKVAENVVVVCPLRNATVPVELEIFAVQPETEHERWQHIVECSLNLPTGHLQVHECTGGAVLDLHLPSGTYQVRLLFTGLETINDDGATGQDRYVIQVWPGNWQDLVVVKRW